LAAKEIHHPTLIVPIHMCPRTGETAMTEEWDDEVDVVVVGFGGAGACAAIEAVENGADVLLLERFNGGGATRMSGGVVYCGGGTEYQKSAGFDDTPENMAAYLKMEAEGIVTEETIMRFSQESTENLLWLEKHGVEFGKGFCPYKTSYPIDAFSLYFSGNESFPPYSDTARPAPRGHRAAGAGMPGSNLFKPLKESALKKMIRVRYQSQVKTLFTDSSGRVTGVEVSSVSRRTIAGPLHRLLGHAAYQLRYVTLAWPWSANIFSLSSALLELRGRPYRVKARKGVILAAGGFIRNRKMVAQYAPAFRTGTPLGTVGDDGSGIQLGQSVGGDVGAMDSVSAWRFINPPLSFVQGIFVDQQGNRICNEQYYGAQLGDKMVKQHKGKGFLIIDRALWKKSFSEVGPGKTQWFQTLPALANLLLNNHKGNSVRQLATRCGIDPDRLETTVESYNKTAQTSRKDPMGKAPEMLHPLSPPYYAINCSIGSRLHVCAVTTMGGLIVDEITGQVKRPDGSLVGGLYAAGRSAVGLTSTNYVSGLSIADAVFSGRRAGRHAACGA
jgi:3-oxo-5alpha-steroid 4-dehydrogenase